jgi:hypothetical protein
MPNVAVYSYIPSTTTAPEDPPRTSVDLSLRRTILLVEPDITVLSAEALLLTNSNYCVTTAFSQLEIFLLRDIGTIALAIVSASLGRCLLRSVAEGVRKQWPLARILVLGHAASVLEDNLYDEEIDPYPQPKQRSNTLDWDASRSLPHVAPSSLRESDPTKAAPHVVPDQVDSRGTPSGIKYRQK